MQNAFEIINSLYVKQEMSSSDANMQKALQSTFETHHQEIRRRSEITQSRSGSNEHVCKDDHTFTKVVDAQNFDFYDDSKKFIVFSLSQQKFAPVPVECSNPAICIFGGFPSHDEAMEYAQFVMKSHDKISVFIDEIHKWIVGAKNPENINNADYITAHKEKLLDDHKQMLQKNNDDFLENVKNQQMGDVSASSKESDTQDTTITYSDSRSHKISNNMDVRGQKLVVASFLKDRSDVDVPEFMFQIFGFFETEEETNAYIRNVCGDEVKNLDIDVVSTCDWIFPQRMHHDKVKKEVFRSDELDNIMRTHKNQPKEVAKFKEVMEKY